MHRWAIIPLVFAWPLTAFAQQGSRCSNPIFEKRLIAAVAKGEVQLKAIPTGKAEAYARCYAREACSALSKIEFEMYALSAITGYGDDKAEQEYLTRMRRHRKENNSAGDKVSPNALGDACKREIGLK